MSNLFPNFKKKNDIDEDVYNGIYIPKRFHDAVLKHLIFNYSRDVNGFAPALFLAIQGDKGEGKSFMLQQICNFYSIECSIFSGAQLCGNFEGDSFKELLKTYENLCVKAKNDRRFYCIVIEDFHKSIAAINQDNMSRTTNSDTLIGRLMNLADNPYVMNSRIPIILTGNDFTSIYTALTRVGRMDFFDWQPDIGEKKKMVYYMYKCFYPHISYEMVERLVDTYRDSFVAFFKTVLLDVFWGDCQGIIESFCQKRSGINLDNITNLITDSNFVNKDISIDLLLKYAQQRNRSIAKNFDKRIGKNYGR